MTKDSVLVDVGEKNEGTVPLIEFVADLAAPKSPAPQVGQRVPVIKVGGRNKAGHAVLSHVKAKTELGWELAIKAHAEKQRVRGIVKSAVKGGFIVDVQGIPAFLPASLADLRPVRQPEKMIGTGVRFQIDPKTIAFAPAAECDADVIYKLGDAVTGLVTGVDSQAFEVRVSLARFNEIKDRKRVAQYMKAPPPLTLGQILSPEDDS